MDVLSELAKKEHYAPVFTALRKKAQEENFRLRTRPASRSITLEWAMASEERVTRYLAAGIRKRTYLPQVCTRNELDLDKRRTVYSFNWPDRILESALARLFASAIEPHLSPGLYSYRKGFNNHQAVRAFAACAAEHARRGAPLYVVKRDIESFGESVDIEILQRQLRGVLGEQDPYFWGILQRLLRPEYRDPKTGTAGRLSQGLPDGCCLTTVCENLYLSAMDRELAHAGFYCRYGDDVIFAHEDPDRAASAAAAIDRHAREHRLRLKQEKLVDGVFGRRALPPLGFRRLTSLDYLGYNVGQGGKIFLPDKKVQLLQGQLRRTAKYAFLANRRDCRSKAELIAAIISSLNAALACELQHPYLAMLLANCNDDRRLGEFDKWLAKLALRFVYRSGHDRVFRHCSYKEIRRAGLVSVLHASRTRRRT